MRQETSHVGENLCEGWGTRDNQDGDDRKTKKKVWSS